MPTYKNISDVNFTKGFEELLYYVNDVTNSYLSNMFLVAVYIITLLGILWYKKDVMEGIATAGFFVFVVSFFFWIAGFVSGYTLIYTTAVAIIGFAMLWIGKH